MSLDGFDSRWRDFPDYIIGITKEIWEERGIDKLNHYYAQDIPVRAPMGIVRGNQAVIDATRATLDEFPDRELFGEDVIWSQHETGLLSSHRILSTATHSHDGAFGKATGKSFRIYIIADCAAAENTIFDEWLVRDYGALVRQLGMDPERYTKELIELEGGAANCQHPFTPALDVDGGYRGKGNNNAWGERYANVLQRIMAGDSDVFSNCYDRAVIGEYAGGQRCISTAAVANSWHQLRTAFPDAQLRIHHQIGMDTDMLPPRAAIRWSLDGTHDGDGLFGPASGVPVHIMGISHAEFGPFGENPPTVRREWSLYDEIAIWKQILMQSGDKG
ncbi:MAG: ester cyclase [Granulosicoccus sp.]